VRRTRDGDFRFFDRRGWPLPQRPRATGVGRVVESRFEVAGRVAAEEAVVGGKDTAASTGRRNGAAGESEAPDPPPRTLEEMNRKLGIDPKWHTAAARFSGNVDDPRNHELRDLMFGAMDALDPGEAESNPAEAERGIGGYAPEGPTEDGDP